MKARGRLSAGLLLFRRGANSLEILLVHPGGPFFKHKDDGHWTIPKGEINEQDDPLATALREFKEETGFALDPGTRTIELGSIRQKGGKVVHAWAMEGDWPAGHRLESNLFEMEWPPKSGKLHKFPEVDRAEFFDIPTAMRKINPAQVPFLERLGENA